LSLGFEFLLRAIQADLAHDPNSALRRRILPNNSLGTATLACWKLIYRGWLTALALIFTNVFCRKVSDD
jgi:hypothetical protein